MQMNGLNNLRAGLVSIAAIILAIIFIGGCSQILSPGELPVESDAKRATFGATKWTVTPVADRPYDEVGKWAEAISAFEASDKTDPPAPGGIVFVGSSSIVFWETLAADMAPLPVIQRGFGGSKIYDAVYYADRIVWPYQPKAIVMFSGTNDIVVPTPGAPERVKQGFIDFVAETRAIFPEIDIHFISMSPTKARWSAVEQVRQGNALVEAVTKTDDHLFYIDTATAVVKDGMSDEALFRDDKLHLNADGYAVWTAIIRPHLMALYAE